MVFVVYGLIWTPLLSRREDCTLRTLFRRPFTKLLVCIIGFGQATSGCTFPAFPSSLLSQYILRQRQPLASTRQAASPTQCSFVAPSSKQHYTDYSLDRAQTVPKQYRERLLGLSHLAICPIFRASIFVRLTEERRP